MKTGNNGEPFRKKYAHFIVRNTTPFLAKWCTLSDNPTCLVGKKGLLYWQEGLWIRPYLTMQVKNNVMFFPLKRFHIYPTYTSLFSLQTRQALPNSYAPTPEMPSEQRLNFLPRKRISWAFRAPTYAVFSYLCAQKLNNNLT
jgi:hypothetical protein